MLRSDGRNIAPRARVSAIKIRNSRFNKVQTPWTTRVANDAKTECYCTPANLQTMSYVRGRTSDSNGLCGADEARGFRSKKLCVWM